MASHVAQHVDMAARAAHHEGRQERAAMTAQIASDVPLRDPLEERHGVVEVPAADVVVEATHLSYPALAAVPPRAARRKRKQDATLEAATRGPSGGEVADGGHGSGAAGDGLPAGTSMAQAMAALVQACEEAPEPEEDEPAASGPKLVCQLEHVRRKLRAFVARCAACGEGVPMVQAERGLYPTWQWTRRFFEWMFLESHQQWCRAALWEADGQERSTLGADWVEVEVEVAMKLSQGHVWREVWPAIPYHYGRSAYWAQVFAHVTALWDGGGGVMTHAAVQAGEAVALDSRDYCPCERGYLRESKGAKQGRRKICNACRKEATTLKRMEEAHTQAPNEAAAGAVAAILNAAVVEHLSVAPVAL